MRPSRLRIGVVIFLSAAACGSSSDPGSDDQLKGFWYLPSAPTTRGLFTTKLSFSGESVTGTVALVGHPRLGTMQVSGTYHEGYSAGVWNGRLSMNDSADRASFSFLVPGGGRLDDRSIASGTLSEAGQTDRPSLYLVPGTMGVFEPTGALHVDGTGLRGLAASSDGTMLWADLSPQGVSPFIMTITNGAIDTATRAPPSGAGRLLTWWNNRLWFPSDSSNTFNGYAPSDFAQAPNTLTLARAPGGPLAGVPVAVAFVDDAAWGLVGIGPIDNEVVAWDKSGLNPELKLTGEDLRSLAWCNGHLVTMKDDRNGFIDSILVSSSPASSQWKAYPVPVEGPTALACSSSTLYVGAGDGWIFQIPMGQVVGP